jgi:hypothetical protein
LRKYIHCLWSLFLDLVDHLDIKVHLRAFEVACIEPKIVVAKFSIPTLVSMLIDFFSWSLTLQQNEQVFLYL